ncbi:MAG TPA: hypothetical protein DIC34_12275 [Treponema sp.]|nr:MAG: hypothetical protein A2Y36_16145 [Treponema sp. GWA1_62_8]OHE67849.1 MAG: hypothetical protein A2001_20420 [Treponema sp. GWC1_61_84]OHE74779.1 MAG: hypothetical protein A2413_05925 [Treponema sp. RIFOXYC1_FULL_61_9]HCM27300.1 hypothetical protein [Treponema sp.]
MIEESDSDLINTLSVRIKADLRLIRRLLDEERFENGSTGRICALVCAVTLGTEALFIEASTTRVDLSRHLRAVTAAVAAYCGVGIEWTEGDHLPCEARRAVLAGLATADLCRLNPVSRVSVKGIGNGVCVVNIAADVRGERAAGDSAFARRLAEKIPGGDFTEHSGGFRLAFRLLPDGYQSAFPAATSSLTRGRTI